MDSLGGFFLGALNGQDLYHPGEGSAFVFAPPGAGKGVCSVIPQFLLPHFDQRGRPVSLLALDLKGEIYSVTARRMRELGCEVVAIAPWAEKMSRELGIPIMDAGFNPTLLTPGPDIKDEAELRAELLLPGSQRTSNSAEYFLDYGRSILAWGLMVLARQGDPKRMNLVELRSLLMQRPEEFEKLLAESCVCDDFGGAIKQYANKLVSTKLDAPEEWSGAINTATKALRIYDDFGPLGRSVSAINGFKFERIKNKPTCVYLIIPAERLATHANWLNLTLSVAIEQMALDRTNQRVLVVLDEFCNAGYLPGVLKAMGLYRSQGLQFAFYAQTASQIRRLYGEDGLRDFLGMSEVIQAFGVRDPETLRMLSELAGQDTVKEFSQNLQPDLMAGVHLGFSSGAMNQGRPLIRPEDIRTLPDDKQLIFYRNLPPFLADKVSYLSRRAWRKYADQNPYYRE